MSRLPHPAGFEFGPFRFDVASRRLTRDGSVVPLKPKVADTLLLLLVNRDRVMSKAELIRELWPDSFVEESNLSQNIYTLRGGLGDDGGRRYVETIPRRGYRFCAEVREVGHESPLQTIAVLPFRPLTIEARDESLELGIADSLITTLARSGQLIVRPISASRRFAGLQQDALDAARQLGVAVVLEGTIQTTGEMLRVTARLLRAVDGVALWAGRYHERITDIFEVQDSITHRISVALEPALGQAKEARHPRQATPNGEAYRAYLNGRYNAAKGTEEGLRKAIGFFQQAVAIDPRYALAYVGLADAYTCLDWYGVLSTRESNPLALAAAEHALRLEPDLADAHAALAVARQYRWEWPEAEAAFRRAIDLNPHLAAAHHWFGVHLAYRGRMDEALHEIAAAEALDPMSLTVRAQHSLILYFARRYDEAIARCHAVLEVEPAHDEARLYLAFSLIETSAAAAAVNELRRTSLLDTPDVQAMCAMALAAAGRRDEARAWLGRISNRTAATYVPHLWIAAALTALGETNAALCELEAAVEDPDDSFASVAVAPFLDRLRPHPRFQRVLARIGLLGQPR